MSIIQSHDPEHFLTSLVGGDEGLAIMRSQGWCIPIGQPNADGKGWPSFGWQGGPVPRGRTHWSPVLVAGTAGAHVERQARAVVWVLAVVGDEAPEGFLGLPEWARLQTSPGKAQAIWKLSTPVDRARASAITATLRAGIGTDPSGNNPERWARLPTRDIPFGKKSAAELVAIDGDSIDPLDLELALYSALNAEQRDRLQVFIAGGGGAMPQDAVELAKVDPLFQWMLDTGRVMPGRKGDAWLVKCPYGHEHTPDASGEVGMAMNYMPGPPGEYWFKCHRGTVDGKSHLARRAEEEGWGSTTRLVKHMFRQKGAPISAAEVGTRNVRPDPENAAAELRRMLGLR